MPNYDKRAEKIHYYVDCSHDDALEFAYINKLIWENGVKRNYTETELKLLNNIFADNRKIGYRFDRVLYEVGKTGYISLNVTLIEDKK